MIARYYRVLAVDIKSLLISALVILPSNCRGGLVSKGVRSSPEIGNLGEVIN